MDVTGEVVAEEPAAVQAEPIDEPPIVEAEPIELPGPIAVDVEAEPVAPPKKGARKRRAAAPRKGEGGKGSEKGSRSRGRKTSPLDSARGKPLDSPRGKRTKSEAADR